jgi:chemotaxis protein methyltransferase CheR
MDTISDSEFAQFQRFIYETAGITLSDAKKTLVSGRLAKRLQHYQLDSYASYFRVLTGGTAPEEVQTAVDLLTTNETYFFREAKHFDCLRERAIEARHKPGAFRVWSAASSSGEEAYSMAMVLADCLSDNPWEIFGSDISSRILEKAIIGHYPVERAKNIPEAYLRRFCLKGIGQESGTLLIEKNLRSRVSFRQINLNSTLPELGLFDVIFLRNVMIYFSNDTKRQVVARVIAKLKPGGTLCIGHAESLNDISSEVQMIAPSIYRKS